jgi:uncharacterized membrane protein
VVPTTVPTQLSVAVGAVTLAEHSPVMVERTLESATGASLSTIVTVNEQTDTPTALVAVAVTVVVPTGKKLPLAGLYVIVDAGIAVVSVAEKLTFAPH